jgi:hypothetical protein
MAQTPPNADMMFEAMMANSKDPASVLKRLETLEFVMERSFTIPGINRAVGLDAIIGLVPVIGDFISAAIGSYLVWEARNLGLPKWKLARMMANIGVDTAIGAVPFIGDAFDVMFRSNTRNLRIVKAHLQKHHPATVIIDQ